MQDFCYFLLFFLDDEILHSHNVTKPPSNKAEIPFPVISPPQKVLDRALDPAFVSHNGHAPGIMSSSGFSHGYSASGGY